MEYLQQLQETSLESDGFVIRYRMLEMRVPVDRLVQRELDNVIHIKCVATVDAVPSVGRETKTVVALRSHRSSLFGFGGNSRAASRTSLVPALTLNSDLNGGKFYRSPKASHCSYLQAKLVRWTLSIVGMCS